MAARRSRGFGRVSSLCYHTSAATNQRSDRHIASDSYTKQYSTFKPSNSLPPNNLLSQHSLKEYYITSAAVHRLQYRGFSSGVDGPKDGSLEQKDGDEKRPGIMKRFKDAYREYGKVLIAVHVATSCVWYGSFVYAAASGVDVVPLLEYLGASQTIIKPFKSSGAGNFAVAYLMYKIATPARYMVTIGGTQFTVKKLREFGYMAPRSEEDSIRNLMKEGKQEIKTKISDKKDDLKERMEEKREDIKDRVGEFKDDWKDKVDDFRDDLKTKKEDFRGKLSERKEDFKDKFGDFKDDLSSKKKSQ